MGRALSSEGKTDGSNSYHVLMFYLYATIHELILAHVTTMCYQMSHKEYQCKRVIAYVSSQQLRILFKIEYIFFSYSFERFLYRIMKNGFTMRPFG